MQVNYLLTQFKANILSAIKKHNDSLADIHMPLLINGLAALVARQAKGTAYGSPTANQALDIEGDMVSLANRVGDMSLADKLSHCIETAGGCLKS